MQYSTGYDIVRFYNIFVFGHHVQVTIYFSGIFLLMITLQAAERQNDSAYTLGTGTKGEQALAIQQKFMAENSYAQLKRAGLKRGMKVYDIGCGSGEMTAYLAQQVSETGRVYAVDASEEQLKLTRERIEALKLKNVEYIQADIQTYQDWPLKEADIVYARFVLMHLSNVKNALNNIHNLLKPGGMLSLQETTLSTIQSSFSSAEIGNYRDAVIALGKKNEADYNLGGKLPYICKELPFNVVYVDDLETKLKIPVGKALLIARIPELGDKIVEAKIATAEDVDGWVKIITDLPDEDEQGYINVGNVMHILLEKIN